MGSGKDTNPALSKRRVYIYTSELYEVARWVWILWFPLSYLVLGTQVPLSSYWLNRLAHSSVFPSLCVCVCTFTHTWRKCQDQPIYWPRLFNVHRRMWDEIATKQIFFLFPFWLERHLGWELKVLIASPVIPKRFLCEGAFSELSTRSPRQDWSCSLGMSLRKSKCRELKHMLCYLQNINVKYALGS